MMPSERNCSKSKTYLLVNKMQTMSFLEAIDDIHHIAYFLIRHRLIARDTQFFSMDTLRNGQ